MAASVVALALPTCALGHGGSGDYESVVDSIEPGGLPIFAEVKDGDDRLRVSNTGKDKLVVLGYEKEPYVRIRPQGVMVNTNSAAYYTNQERYGDTEVPHGVGAGPAKWKRESTGGLPVYEFHDHRIHWMLKTPPPSVDEGDSSRQKVDNWEVPFTYGGRQGVIKGTLTYVGGQNPWTSPEVLVTGAGTVVAAAAMFYSWRRRRPGREG